MRRMAAWIVIGALLCFAQGAAAGVNLSWNDCSDGGGIFRQTFNCNTNSGSNKLVVSFEVPSFVPQVVGITVVVDVTLSSPTVPDWWQFRNSGTCRQNALSANSDASNSACVDWSGGLANGAVTSYQVTGPNTARMVVTFEVLTGLGQDLLPGVEYFAGNILISHALSTGPGSCSGCSIPACLSVSTLTLFSATQGNVVLSGPTSAGRDYAVWQGLFFRDSDGDGFGDAANTTVGECSTPAGYVVDNTDCDDTRSSVHPGAYELCDGLDSDCDGHVDETSLTRTGLLSWWRGEGNANDAAGNANGTPQNGATFAAGRIGQAFSLDGVNDHIDNFGTASTFAFIENTGVFTIEGWIKLNDPNATTEQAIIANTATTIEKGFYFTWDNSAGQQKLTLALMKAQSGNPVIASSSANHVITSSDWHHVAAVGNGTGITFYVDGTAYPGSGVMGSMPTGNPPRAVDIGHCSVQCLYSGLIDELAIYNRPLTASEIQRISAASADARCTLLAVDDRSQVSSLFKLLPPSPNPTHQESQIRFVLPTPAKVRLEIVDLAGRRVRTALRGIALPAGMHEFSWDGADDSSRRVATGIYEVRLITDTFAAARKVVMVQ